MNKISKILIFITVLGFLIIPFLTKAAGLVPCGQPDAPQCRLCHVLFLIRNVINFILKVLVPLGILFIVIGGIVILISRGTHLATIGRKLVRSALMGIIIALVAGAIINSVIAFIANPSVFPFPWYAFELQCPIVKIPLSNAMTSSYSLITDVNPAGVSPGDTLRYSLTYTNISSQNLSNLDIVIDYDQNQVTSITNISTGGTDDGDKITWKTGNLGTKQSVTVSYDFVLTTDFVKLLSKSFNKANLIARIIEKIAKLITKTALSQTSPTVTAYYHNVVTVTSNEAEEDTLDDPLKIVLPNTIFTNRNYYLTIDSNNDKRPSAGDKLRYNIKYFNPTIFDFPNAVIISDYDQASIKIIKIDGGGIDDGDKVTWNLGNLPVGQPSVNNPGCLGYDFTIQNIAGTYISNILYIMSAGGILETNNDKFATP